MQSMTQIINNAVELIPDPQMKKALADYIQSPQPISHIEAIESFFDQLTAAPRSQEQTDIFVHNWSKIHLSSQSVAGLMVRLLGNAEEAQGFKRDNLFMASAQMAHVIAEDTGVQGVSHHRMYDTFARTLTGGDGWKSEVFELPAVQDFREYVEKSRNSESIETGILTTFASEIINTAEYTYVNQKIMPWMVNHQQINASEARRAIAYVHVHAGETELDHAQHAHKAWKHLEIAERKQRNPKELVSTFDRYLQKVSGTYAALGRHLALSPDKKAENANDNRIMVPEQRRVYNWITP